MKAASEISVITSIADVNAPARVWLADIWGVIHNGVRPFMPATEACRKFREVGGTVILLSNAPRPGEAAAAQLDRIGVPRAAWDAIVSSGDLSRELIRAAGWRAICHIGPERDLGLYEGLDVRHVSPDTAQGAVCTGLVDDERETPEDYRSVLAACARRGLQMVCANPDLTVERGNKIVYCAGAIAGAYEALGGVVTYAGKPHLPIYDMALNVAKLLCGGAVEKEQLLAIGDGVRTDIAGAAAFGIRSVFVASGVHVEAGRTLDAALLGKMFPDPKGRPVAAMYGLAW